MKKILSLLLSVVLLITILPLCIFASDESSVWDGETITQPTKLVVVDSVYYYEISTAEELAYIAQTGGEWGEFNYILTNNIVLNDTELTYDTDGNLTVDADSLNEWTPFSFSGSVFDGNGYTVSGVYVNSTNSYTGFFSKLENTTVKNLTITNSFIISNKGYTGGLCGNTYFASIYNCSFDGAAIGTFDTSGLVGKLDCSHISDCVNYGDIWSLYQVGGIVGAFYAYGINGCINYGNVTGTGSSIGGIAGWSYLYSFYECVNYGNILGGDNVGGVCGYCRNNSYVASCGNTGTVTGDNYVGGVVGYAADAWSEKSVTITSSYNTGAVNGSSYVGGIIGYGVYAIVGSSYNIGDVSGTTDCGAVCGYSGSIWGKGEVSNCYYLKNNEVNASLYGFGNTEDDITGVIDAKDINFFCINEDNTLNLAGHTEIQLSGTEATCTENGLSNSSKCSACGEVISEQTVILALGHDYSTKWTIDTAATCTTTGEKSHHCTNCSAKTDETVIPATGHTEEILASKAATCTETGLTEGKKCSVCGEIISEQEEIPATGHDYVGVTTAPTYTQQDYTVYTCSHCGDSYTSNYVNILPDPATEDNITEEPSTEEPTSEEPTTEEPTTEEPTNEDLTNEIIEIMLGDLNDDGNITAADARIALRISAQLEEPNEKQSKAADVNNDDKITAADARIILRVSAKLETL